MRTRFYGPLLLVVAACNTNPPSTTDPDEVTIMEIQGDTFNSDYANSTVITEGVVTAVFPELEGYFLQDADGDGDETTSDGIFVNATSNYPSVGDQLRLTARVEESSGLTQLTQPSNVETLASGQTIQPTSVSFPISLESVEGMLVSFPQTLEVIANNTLGRYGEVMLAPADQYVVSQVLDANDESPEGTTYAGSSQTAGWDGITNGQERDRITLDDGTTEQNPEPIAYGTYSQPIIGGSTTAGITGVVHFAFGRFALEPTEAVSFRIAEPATVAEKPEDTNLTIASFNVENYFNGNGSGGAFTGRGPGSQEEFDRQTTKVVEVLRELDADIVGLQEIENDGASEAASLSQLVVALNAAVGDNTYAAIYDPVSGVNSDVIRNAYLYKPSQVTPVGDALADSDDTHNRLPITQVFSVNSNGVEVMLVNVHLRSKSCSGASGDNTDQGQGCQNARRTEQAEATYAWIEQQMTASGVSAVAVLGDFNAYSQEDPIDRLRAEGFVDVLTDSAYTYVFDGRKGALDHIMLSESLSPGLLSAQAWNINADYPEYLDYTTDFNPAAAYLENPWRASDHDPVVAHLQVDPSMNRGVLGRANRLGLRENTLQADLYPNPARGEALLSLEGLQGSYEVAVYTSQGKQVWSRVDSTPLQRDQVAIPMASWPAGSYVVAVSSNGVTQQLLLAKE